MNVVEFVRESNRIEGIRREPTAGEIAAHKVFFGLQRVTVPDVERLVSELAGAELRDRPGMNVRVGSHRPIPGGPQIRNALWSLLDGLDDLTPFEAHVVYETLHPFMDGNGRSGRALWVWMMRDLGLDAFELPFLHRWYYQSLDAQR